VGPFDPPQGSLVDDLYIYMLPAAACTTCNRHIARRQNRVVIRATWRQQNEILCPECWGVICEWARRFALRKAELPLFEGN
jgi:hypothetical protein